MRMSRFYVNTALPNVVANPIKRAYPYSFAAPSPYCTTPHYIALHYTSLPLLIHFSVLSRMVQVLPSTSFLNLNLRELHPSSFFFFCFRSRSAAVIHLYPAVFHPSSSTSLRLEECNSTNHQTALYSFPAPFSSKSVLAPTFIQTAFTFPLLTESSGE